MSGKPSVEGAERLMALARLAAGYEDRQRELQDQLAPLTKELNQIIAERRAIAKELAEVLGKMDVTSPGNFGWTARLSWLVVEFARQAAVEGS